MRAPSISRFAPLVLEDTGLEMNTTPDAISSAVPIRPVGLSPMANLNRSGFPPSIDCHTPPGK